MELTHYQRLKICREQNKRKQEEVAEALGMTRSNYSLIENGKVKLTPLHLKTLKEKFGFDIDYIINGNENDEKLIIPELKKEQISRRLKQLREEKGEIMQEVADATNINIQTLYGYEKGVQPNLPKIKALAKHFGVSIEYILHGTDRKIHELKTQKVEVPNEIPDWGKQLIEQMGVIKDIILKMQSGGNFSEGNLSTDNVFPFHPNRQTEKNVIGWY